jgi:hypothetical protein
MISQVTVFLENAEGRLAALTRVMARAEINMKALSIAENDEYGVIRIICPDTDKAVEALNEAGYRVMKTPVSAIAISDTAGGLSKLMEIFDEANVNVQYGYCFSEANQAIAVMKIPAANSVAVAEKVAAAGFKVLTQADLA